MSRVTSKLQVTIPKKIAREYGIEPGSDVVFEPAGEVIRLRTVVDEKEPLEDDAGFRLKLFDRSTARQKRRNPKLMKSMPDVLTGRGWRRGDLYDRGLSR